MNRAVIGSYYVSIVVAMATCLTGLSQARAETQFTLGPPPTAAVAWTSPGTWNEPGFPNATTHSANLARPLAASLTANIGSTDILLAGLTMGSTTSAITTNISGSGSLVFQNDDAGFNAGVPLITSAGVPGATNTVSVAVLLNEQLDFSAASSNNVRVSGLVTAFGTAPSIRSFMPAGLVAKIDRLDLTDPNDEFNYRHFRLNDSAGSPPEMPAVSTQGTLEIGEVFGNGELRIGVTAGQQPVPLGTVILRGPNYSGGFVQLNRANVVLANDHALGQYAVFGGQPNQAVGMNLLSDNDNRQMYVEARVSQWFTIKGDHSLTWNNVAVQTNSRGWINLLPAGKTFTLHGGQYAMSGSDTERTFSYDGTGHTVVTGGLHDKYDFQQGPVSTGTGHLRKTGTGTMHVTGSTSTYHGNTVIEAGTLRFSQAEHLTNSPSIVSTGGAIGVDTGIYSDPNLLAKFDAADTGGVMLTSAEATMDLDFTSGDLANAANTSVAAPEVGITYTGTITPAGSSYRLGGGTGRLTLPTQNQLTGDRGLTVTNGGEVELLSTNDYTGPTVVSDYAFNSRTDQAIADTTTGISTSLFAPTTLTVHSLKSGGLDSSIGNSSNDASNLVIRGSTLRIDGETGGNDRLFTIGARGATIQSVGESHALFFNSGALAIESAGPGTRMLTLGADSDVNIMIPLIPDAPDGGIVGVTKIGPGKWELRSDNSYSGQTRIREGQLNIVGDQTGAGETIVDAGATLGGDGTLGGNVTVHGSIAPGRTCSCNSSLHIAGNLLLGPDSETQITIVNTGRFDRLEVAGMTSLDGTLRVEQPNTGSGLYVFKLGDVFPFLTASGGADGNFDHIESPPLSLGLEWEVTTGESGSLLRVVASLPGDYNFNGIVDAADYTIWRDSFGQEGIGLAADGNLDEKVDDADYTFWKSHFGEVLSGANQSLDDTPAVPEPNCWILFALAAALLPLRLR